MAAVANVLHFVLLVFLILLIFRLVMEYVFMLARSYRPAGVVAIALELCYTVTDPPLKALRRVIPPLRVGRVSLDLSFIVLFIAVQILLGVLSGIR
ncbi:MAG: YggT family protein [Actinobacteria bacterium]|nr:YggT family protein [Actinomycetota bacterium]MCA1721912.1 YggT family protein [Actinomycetota bacterium]